MSRLRKDLSEYLKDTKYLDTEEEASDTLSTFLKSKKTSTSQSMNQSFPSQGQKNEETLDFSGDRTTFIPYENEKVRSFEDPKKTISTIPVRTYQTTKNTITTLLAPLDGKKDEDNYNTQSDDSRMIEKLDS